jgi:polysaccharide export outer membrane protein
MPAARSRCLPAALLAVHLAGCGTLGARHEENRIEQPGIIDPHQPKELEMSALPAYRVEPPDELEISIRPAVLDLPSTNNLIVQPDGTIDLGFAGDIFVTGLTLAEIEVKIAHHLRALTANERRSPPPRRGQTAGSAPEPIRVAARLINGSQSKVYYVLGAVTTQGKFPSTGNETVLDVILTAGLRSNNVVEKAYLVRPKPHGGPPNILRIDWDAITKCGDTLTNYQVLPGDRIIVPGRRLRGLAALLGG